MEESMEESRKVISEDNPQIQGNPSSRRPGSRKVAILVCLAILVFAACGIYRWNLPPQKLERALREADALLEEGSFAEAAQAYGDAADAYEAAAGMDALGLSAREKRAYATFLQAKDAEIAGPFTEEEIPAQAQALSLYREAATQCDAILQAREAMGESAGGESPADAEMPAKAGDADQETAAAEGTRAGANQMEDGSANGSATAEASAGKGATAETPAGGSATAEASANGSTTAEASAGGSATAETPAGGSTTAEASADGGRVPGTSVSGNRTARFLREEAFDRIAALQKEIAAATRAVTCETVTDDRSGQAVLADGERIPYGWHYDLVQIADPYYPYAAWINERLEADKKAFFSDPAHNPALAIADGGGQEIAGIPGGNTPASMEGDYLDYVGLAGIYADKGLLSIRMAEVRMRGAARANYYCGRTFRLADASEATIRDLVGRTNSGLRRLLRRKIWDYLETGGYTGISRADVEAYIEETEPEAFPFCIQEDGQICLVLDQSVPFLSAADFILEIPLGETVE